MTLRIIGAVLVVISCSGFGFMLALNYKMEERYLRQLLEAINFMECQLQFSVNTLPELSLSAAAAAGGGIEKVLMQFAAALETNCYTDPSACMDSVLAGQKIPPVAKSLLASLGRTLGSFDLDGQLKALQAVQSDCAQQLIKHTENKDVRIRNYQTLGICAGAALAILLI